MRIAHLSDFHMRHQLPIIQEHPVERSRAIPGLLEAVLQRLPSLQPDLLVVTGDLVDYPLDALDDPPMQERGRADLREVRALLDRANCPLAVVSGNHDHPQLYLEVFGDLPADFVCAGYRILTFNDAEDAEHVPHRTGEDRTRFHTALEDAASLPQIHVQHFLSWPPMQEDYPYNYPDAANLHAQSAASGRVRLVLNGHYHAGTLPTTVDGVTYAGVPAFCESPHPLWIYDLHTDGIQHRIETLSPGV